MTHDVHELVHFTERYHDALDRGFKHALSRVGEVGLPRPAYDVRVFRVLEPRLGRERLISRRKDTDTLSAIRKLKAPDLYLAVAVGEALPEAIARFRDWYSGGVHELAQALAGHGRVAEGLAHNLWEALVKVSPPPAPPPLIAAYDGRSSLKVWLRVVGLKAARESGVRDRSKHARTELADGEKALLASEERQALDTALAGVMAREPAQHRLLFALSELEGLGSAEAAHLINSDPARVETILRKLRRRLRQALERALREEHGYDGRAVKDYWKRAERAVGDRR